MCRVNATVVERCLWSSCRILCDLAALGLSLAGSAGVNRNETDKKESRKHVAT